jgi:adenosylhomocysteine nucleosidase
MKYKILLVALKEELPVAPANYKVIYTGVGKVNAAYETTRAIIEANQLGFQPEVYNFGTAGSCKKELSGLHRVTKFIQRDMNAEPLLPRGYTPFDKQHLSIAHTEHGVTLGTGDQFVHELESWYIDNNIDLVDMEAYAIASVCKKMNVEFICYKYISDYVGTPHQSEVWSKNVANGINEILKILT